MRAAPNQTPYRRNRAGRDIVEVMEGFQLLMEYTVLEGLLDVP